MSARSAVVWGVALAVAAIGGAQLKPLLPPPGWPIAAMASAVLFVLAGLHLHRQQDALRGRWTCHWLASQPAVEPVGWQRAGLLLTFAAWWLPVLVALAAAGVPVSAGLVGACGGAVAGAATARRAREPDAAMRRVGGHGAGVLSNWPVAELYGPLRGRRVALACVPALLLVPGDASAALGVAVVLMWVLPLVLLASLVVLGRVAHAAWQLLASQPLPAARIVSRLIRRWLILWLATAAAWWLVLLLVGMPVTGSLLAAGVLLAVAGAAAAVSIGLAWRD